MSDILSTCSWPNVAEPYATALRSSVAFVCGEVNAVGIVATGTVIRGTPHQSSDLDLYVIHNEPFRRRVQRFFGERVPTEIFINPPSAIRSYFVEENDDGRPLTAHMLATGYVVFERGPDVKQLRLEAKEWLERPSFPNQDAAIRARYDAAIRLEDATDVAREDSTTSSMLMSQAVIAMLEFWCRARLGHVPRGKDLLAGVTDADPDLGALARRVFSDVSFSDRTVAAINVAERTIGVTGFFEWDSGFQALAYEQSTDHTER